MVEYHSVTGQSYIVAVPKNLDHIEGMSVEASREYLHQLMLPGLGGGADLERGAMGSAGLAVTGTQFPPSHVYSHAWRQYDCVVWDNEHILHSTTPVALYGGGQRVVWQIIQDVGPEEASEQVNPSARKSGTSHQRMRIKRPVAESRRSD